jgi:exosortase A-associated hydrolase 1
MSIEERAIAFPCDLDQLVAIVSVPRRPLPRGVLLVVGGPQYRAGSHRQFTLLCRALAAQGIPAMRFDVRGMGDSEGEARNFEDIAPDMRAAIDRFFVELPALREVVIWGLCDAASAALTYAHLDPRVTGLVLLNPWVRTIEGFAKAQLKHYYWSRLTDRTFWRKLLRGELAFASATGSFFNAVLTALGIGKNHAAGNTPLATSAQADSGNILPLPERMADGLHRFDGKVLLILSGRDLTAQEFEEVVRGSAQWRRLVAKERVEHRKLDAATHTFSTREWRDQVATWTADWVQSW